MNIFITGATGFLGSAVTTELIGAGHRVLGLTRSDNGADQLLAAGAKPHRGDLQDLESLRAGARQADAVIHLGFIGDFSTFKENCAIDQRAIETLGSAISGSNKPLIVPNGIAGLKPPGYVLTEDDDVPADYPFPRVSEQTALGLASRGVRAAVIRLPQVHSPKRQGFVSRIVTVAREKGVAAYIGAGDNRWPAAHVTDVATLFRLVVENAAAGAKYHAVAEEGIDLRAIAQVIGRRLNVPTKSLMQDENQAYFGPLAIFMGQDMPASSVSTRTKTGWQPQGPGLIADLEQLSS